MPVENGKSDKPFHNFRIQIIMPKDEKIKALQSWIRDLDEDVLDSLIEEYLDYDVEHEVLEDDDVEKEI